MSACCRFAARREWRALAIATGVTAAVVAVSWLMDPTAWMAWIDMLIRAPGGPPAPGSINISPVIRIPIAALVIVYAARTDRRWLVPVGVFIALPVLWWGSLTVLVAVVALQREEIERRLAAAIAAVRSSVKPAGRQRPFRQNRRPEPASRQSSRLAQTPVIGNSG